jgi:hypothetical protein
MEQSTHPGLTLSRPVAVALTTPNRFVTLNSGNTVLCGANGKALGVIENKFDVGEQAAIVVTGTVLVEVGSGGVTAMTQITSDANGKAIAVAALTVPGTITGMNVTSVITGTNAVIPDGEVPMTGSSAKPALTMTQGTVANTITQGSVANTLAGGLLPVKINGVALQTVAEGGFVEVLLSAA